MHGIDVESVRLCDDKMDERKVRREMTFDGIHH
jgi:hypothetical protein